MQPAAPVAGFLEGLGGFLADLPAAALQILGSPVTIGAEIAQRAGICTGCAGQWTRVLDSLGAWSVDYATGVIRDFATDPRTWVTLALVAASCVGTAGAGCVAAATAAITQAAVDLGEKVGRDIEARARQEVETQIMSLPDRARDFARAEGDRIVDAAGEEARAKTRAAAGDLLYALAPRALLDMLERGGSDADRIIAQSVAPVAELARRIGPLTGAAEAAAAVQEARVGARGALTTAVRVSIRTGEPIQTTARAALEPLLAAVASRLQDAAARGAAGASNDLGGNLQNLSLAWDPRQVRAALVTLYAAAAAPPGDPRRVAATAPIWQVATTAAALAAAPLASYIGIREARVNAIAQAAPLAAIRSALRARDRIAADKPYPYADQAIRRYVETHAESVRPVMLTGRNNSAEALAAALAPGLAASLGVRAAAPVAASAPVARELDATRPDFAAGLADRVASRRVELAAPPPGIPWGKIGLVAGALGLGYVLTR